MPVIGWQYAQQANSDKYTGVPYSKLDCQAFVEEVLKDSGVRKPDGTPYNWTGSNKMWRTALYWKGTIEECINTFGDIPLGAWVFIVKNDGGEKARGYNDKEGNASHVGIYALDRKTSPDCIRDSTKTKTRDGVGYRPLDGFTHVGLPYMLEFFEYNQLPGTARAVTKEQALQALETLTNYIKGV